MTEATKRSIFRWIHIICGIPILGYIYDSPSDTHNYASVSGISFFPYCSFRDCGCGKAMSFGDYCEAIGLTIRCSEPHEHRPEFEA
jgi:hypothetical protein